MGSVLLFAANDGGTGLETWLTNTDGTSVSLVDLFPGTGSSLTNFLSATVNGEVYFEANNGQSGVELYRSDGTVEGTGLFADIAFGPDSSSPFDNLPAWTIAIGDTLFLSPTVTDTGRELYSTTGDAAPSLVRDIYPGADSSQPYYMVDLNGTLIFHANDGISGIELYRSDGTEAGTQRLKDILPGTGSSVPYMHQGNVLGDELFFGATDGAIGYELWKTDGTSEGTVLVRDIFNGAGNGFPGYTAANTDLNGTLYVEGMTALNGAMYFSADNGTNGHELWRSDGTEGGTNLVKDIHAGANSSNITKMTELDGALLFFADDGTNGVELWRSDGSSAGTTLVRDIRPGANDSFVRVTNYENDAITIFKGKGYFIADDGSNGVELWETDGTTTGTRLFKDISPGAGIGDPRNLVVVDDLMYFAADDGTSGRELWVTDGTREGTRQVEDIRAGGAGSGAIPIAAIDVNVAPENITLSGTSISENVASFTPVGTLAATDADGDTLVFSLSDDAGGRFAVGGALNDQLVTAGSLDFETAQSHAITVVATDPDGESTSETFTINVSNLVEAPTAPTLSNTSVNENSANGTTVGTVASVNPEGGTVSFSLVDNVAGLFTLSGTTLQVAEVLDHEASGTQSVTVRATGNGGTTTDQTFSITINDVNEAPTGLGLSGTSVAENQGAGTAVGTLSATDPEGAALSFALTDSAGGRFALSGNQLQTARTLDFETASTHEITIEARDASGLVTSRTFTVDVINDTGDSSVTLTGDAGPNALSGTPDNDTISGGAGNDTINGLAGNDTLRGDTGTDSLIGGDGDDLIIGGATEDDMRDNIYGGTGNDTLRGGHGNDELRGDAGDDVLSGGFGSDTVIGGTGNDSITGSALGDLLFGSDGNDFINGGFGYDRINGGDGADAFFHIGIFDHGTDFVQDYDKSEGDVLMSGVAGATVDDFQINYAVRERSGDPDIAEAFVIYRPTEQIMWALIDGRGTTGPAAPTGVTMQLGGETFDLF